MSKAREISKFASKLTVQTNSVLIDSLNTTNANIVFATTLSELSDINSATATANQVLTTDGSGNFYFRTVSENFITSLSQLSDVNSTGNANQVLTTDGSGNFYFTTVQHPEANTGGGASLDIGNWDITTDGSSNLLFTYNNVNKLNLNTSGALIVSDDIEAYGNP